MTELRKEQIRELLPQSDPILLVDQARWMDAETIESSVYIDPGWDIFRGHFEKQPILPGVYVIESMAQTADLILLSMPENAEKLPLFSAVLQMRFFRPVFPDSVLQCRAKIICEAGNGMYDCEVKAFCDEKKVASGKITLTLR